MDVCLGVVAPVGIGGQNSIEPDVLAPFHEILGLTEGHEAIGFQIQQTKGSEVVVEHQGIHVRGPKPGSGPEVPGCIDRFGHGKVGPVDNALVLGTRALGGRLHQGQGIGVSEVPGPIRRGHDYGGGAVVLLADVQQMEWVGHHARVLVVIQSDGVPAKGTGIAGGVLAQRHGHPAEVLAGSSVHVHIATNEQAELMRGSHVPPGCGKGLLATRDPLGASGLPQPHIGAEIGGAEADDVVAIARGNGGGGVAHDCVASPSTVGDALPMAQVLDPQRLHQQCFVVGVHLVTDEAVNLVGRDAGVVARCLNRLARELKLAAPGVPGELGLADTNDGGLVPDSVYVGGASRHCQPLL